MTKRTHAAGLITVARLFRGLTVSELATRLGITSRHLRRIASGESNPSLAVAEKLDAELGIRLTAPSRSRGRTGQRLRERSRV